MFLRSIIFITIHACASDRSDHIVDHVCTFEFYSCNLNTCTCVYKGFSVHNAYMLWKNQIFERYTRVCASLFNKYVDAIYY